MNCVHADTAVRGPRAALELGSWLFRLWPGFVAPCRLRSWHCILTTDFRSLAPRKLWVFRSFLGRSTGLKGFSAEQFGGKTGAMTKSHRKTCHRLFPILILRTDSHQPRD